MKSETARQQRFESFRNPVPVDVWIGLDQIADEIEIRRIILRQYSDVMSPEYARKTRAVIAAFQCARDAMKRLDAEATREARRPAR